jgi:hypothetical protein
LIFLKPIEWGKLNYLHFAVSRGDSALASLVLLMEKYCDQLDYTRELGGKGYLLHIAAEAKAPKMIEYLLTFDEFKHNIDRMITSYSNLTALGITVLQRDYESFKVLVDNGADLNFVDHVGGSIMDYGVRTFK